jgi:hypothetical protein
MYGNGLSSNGSQKASHYQTHTYNFMRRYAWLFGFYPYSKETWHYECLIPRESWFTGEEFATGDGYDIVKVFHSTATEDSIKTSLTISSVLPGSGFSPLQGPEYDWLVGREFPYAVWVEESIDALSVLPGGPKVLTTSNTKFKPTYYVSEPGQEYFSLAGLAVKYLNPTGG